MIHYGTETKPDEKPTVAAATGDSKVKSNGDNRIMFYSQVDTDSVLTLAEKLNAKAEELHALSFKYGIPEIPIELRIQSPGGLLLAGFSALDAVRLCKVPVHTIVDGYAASAATLFSVVGTKRFMNKHSYMMIHQLSGFQWGNYEQMKDDMKNSDRFMTMIKEVYKKYTKVPGKKLDEILKHDIWFDVDECLKYGLVDEVLP